MYVMDQFSGADAPPVHRSVSQLSAFRECGIRYKLTRVDGHAERPAWWNIGGRAVHSAIEAYELWINGDERSWVDLGPLGPMFNTHLDEEIARVEADLTERGKSVDRSEWRAARKGAENEAWWRKKGAEMVANYVKKALDDPTSVYRFETGQLCVEYEFMIDVGGVPVKGFIDQARIYPNGDVIIRDLKAGSGTPTDLIQLAIYRRALIAAGVDGQRWGEYYMLRQQSARVYDLNKLDWPYLVEQFQRMHEAEQRGLYLANMTYLCGSCGVNHLCPAYKYRA